MDTTFGIVLMITLFIAVMLIFFNDQPNIEVNYKKMLKNVFFDKDFIETEEELQKKLSILHLQDYFSVLQPKIKQSYRLSFQPLDEELEKNICSQIAGCPLLPKNIKIDADWKFLAQIDCSQINNSLLPNIGFLYFFLNEQFLQEKHQDMIKVVYVQNIDNLEVAPLKIVLKDVKPSKINFTKILSLPEYDSQWVQNTFRPYEIDGYFKLSNAENVHKIFGYPDTIEECQNGNNQILLLQLDTDEQLGLIFGNNGRLFVYISEEDLHCQNFSNVMTMIQDYNN